MATTAEFEPALLKLRDGSEVTVRAIREDDAGKLQAAIRGLSDESRYTRFFSPMRELSPSLLERAVHPEAGRELQLVAVAGPDERIVAGTRFVATETPGSCEFAIVIVDDWHGRGLARQLLELLMRAARERGFTHMEGNILASNAPMLGLAGSLGFSHHASPEGPTVCLVRRELAAP
jgi:acetyltransferase